MFKKINQYLITNYPLVWNLKLAWMLAIAVFVNVIAFLNGFFIFQDKNQLLDYHLFEYFYYEGYAIFYFIICLIIFIIWLNFYVKNNRFKAKYPTSRGYLYKEFLGVLGIILMFSLIPNSFKLGTTIRVAHYISDKDFATDVDIINRASVFTLQTDNGYSNFSRNLSVPIFDTLVTQDQLLAFYKIRKKEYELQYDGAVYPNLITPYFRNSHYNELLFNKLKDKVDFSNAKNLYFTSKYYKYDKYTTTSDLYNNNQQRYAAKYSHLSDIETESIYDRDDNVPTVYSLYNFSQIAFDVPNKPEYTQEYYDKILINLLQNNDREEINKILIAYQKLLDKHKIGYRFAKNQWQDYIPTAPYYIVQHELKNSYETINGIDINKDYINADSMIQMYKNIEIAKFNSSIFNDFQYYILASLLITLIIITFRFSSFKIWLISLVGSGILIIIYWSFIVISSIFNFQYYSEYIIAIAFYIAFIALIIRGLARNSNKNLTGIAINWFVFSSTFILIVLLSLCKEILQDILHHKYQHNLQKLPQYQYIEILDQLTESYFYYFPILYVIAFYFIISWFKKWQAMAEE